MSNDKSAEEIVRELRELLPPQVDYAELVCAEGFAHGQCYVWDDPEPYIISAAADLIESLTAQLLDEKVASQSLRNAASYYETQLTASQQETRAARNELCLKCGRYHEAHKGACDGCRWKEI